MNQLSPQGQKIIEEIAQRYSVSSQAVMTLLDALIAGHGTMAQFSHPELGGMGQWSRGGMIMVGDMFNNALKAKVDGLCTELSDLLSREPTLMHRPSEAAQGDVSLLVPATGGHAGFWWGADLGQAASTGSQNNIRYAYFPATRRLALAIGDQVALYDTEDHAITGVSQQQSGDASLTFTSQRGLVRVADLRRVTHEGSAEKPAPKHGKDPGPDPSAGSAATPDDIFSKLERLSELHTRGIISGEEFAAKKADLLGRI